MSERAPTYPEHIKSKETAAEPATEKQVEHHEQHEHYEKDSLAKIESLKHQAKKEAVSKHETKVHTHEPKHHQTMINRQLKSQALKQTMSHIRRHLSKPEKAFSKVVHQPAIDKVSRVAEKTVARPYGILAAGVTALLGSAVVLFAAKNYGFSYNLSVFFVLLLVGYLGGLILEVVVRTFKKKR